jgi:hypothetical protein
MTINHKTLVSTGEHIGAIRRLGSSYSAEEYLSAVMDAREVGDGEAYATAVLGSERVIATTNSEPDPTGADVYAKALANLKERGVHEPSYEQLRDALLEVAR